LRQSAVAPPPMVVVYFWYPTRAIVLEAAAEI